MRISLAWIISGIILLAACKTDKVSPPVVIPPVAVFNKGVSGDNTVNLLNRVDTAVIANKPDLVIMMVGTNDVRTPNKIIPLTAYKSNLELLIKKIKTGGSELLLMSPPPIGTDKITYPNAVNERIDSATVIMAGLAAQYHCLYIDVNAVFKAAGSPNATAASLINNPVNVPAHPDGVHFTKAGYQFLAETIYNYLKSNNKLAFYKIICFGDSLTFGPFVKGSGTITGETYPADIYILLKK